MIHSKSKQTLDKAATRRNRFIPLFNYFSIEIVKDVALLQRLLTKELDNRSLLNLT